jgi:hypothetical protein
MKHSFTHYYVQSKKVAGDEQPQIVGHSKDDETGEIYYKFLDIKKANKLLADEKLVSPEYKYRVIKEVTTYEETAWQ